MKRNKVWGSWGPRAAPGFPCETPMTDDPEESVTDGRVIAILIECCSRFADFFFVPGADKLVTAFIRKDSQAKIAKKKTLKAEGGGDVSPVRYQHVI